MNNEFLERMKKLIPQEYEAFLESMEKPRYQGLRINRLKADPDVLEQKLPFLLEKSPYSSDSWYVQGKYGLHPYHLQGLFYLQEPSASAPVACLDVQENHLVADLCAAPGSKSTQILSRLKSGFLLSNEFDAKRAQALLTNMERMGAENFAVTNMDTTKLARSTGPIFDRVLVDAPCSGEGMMKKHEEARENWSMDHIYQCVVRQKEIVENGIKMLKPGGEMVYSTCTYAPEENEEIVAWILERFPQMKQIAIEQDFGRKGIETEGMDASMVRRIFPMDHGEGQFIARFRKEENSDPGKGPKTARFLASEKLDPQVKAFLREQSDQDFACYYSTGNKDKSSWYGMNHPFMDLSNAKVLRQGVYLGDLIKKRFEPAHAFYLSPRMIHSSKTKTEVTLEQMDAFVHGEQLNMEAAKGYRTLCYQGIPFGFGKSSQQRITNKYPRGLRLNPGSHLMNPETACQNSEQKEE